MLISRFSIEDEFNILHLAKAKFVAALLPYSGGMDYKGLDYVPVCISLLPPFPFHAIRCKQEPIPAPIMAPVPLIDTIDSTGYTPSIDNYAEILPYVRVHSNVKASSPKPPDLTSSDASISLTAGESRSQHFWHLSPYEIKDIEASVRFFQCKPP